MNKEPVGLYIFRFLLGLGLFAFMCMLYWSSVLIEDNIMSIKNEIATLKNALYAVREDIGKIQNDIKNQRSSSKGEEEKEKGKNAYIDSKLPNLLTVDPFYKKTLPKILGADFKPHGVLYGATIDKPANLHPFSGWATVNDWVGMCSVTLARMEFGKYETLSANMAKKIEERKGKGGKVPEYWVFLRDDVYWQPLDEKMFEGRVKLAPHFFKKYPVTAHDFKFYYDAIMNPYVQKPGAVALRNYFGDIEEIEILDDFTLVVRWKVHEIKDAEGKTVPMIKYVAKMLTGSLQPLPGFVYKYFADGTKIIEDDKGKDVYRTNSVWAQNFSNHWSEGAIISCGAWIFDQMTDRQISFRRNADHFFPLDALTKGRIVEFKSSPVTIWQEFKSNKLDTYAIRSNQLIELKNFLKSSTYKEQENQGSAIRKLEYNENAYAYIGWNMAKTFFKEKKVRQAMTLAINRERIINQYLNGLGTRLTGPFSPFSPNYNQGVRPFPFDPHRAKILLEEEGWYDSDGDGIVNKTIDGKSVSFEFELTYYVKNPTTKAICEYVATALREIGIKCNLNGVDISDLSAAFDDKGFDAICLAWALGNPPEDPRQLWYSAGAKEPGSSNAVGFVNKEADRIINALDFERDIAKRRALYHRFHAIIHEEQPYTFLYVPKTLFLYRDYVKDVFIPAKRQDLIPGADVAQPDSSIFWLKRR